MKHLSTSSTTMVGVQSRNFKAASREENAGRCRDRKTGTHIRLPS
jgi:hypothetical protein